MDHISFSYTNDQQYFIGVNYQKPCGFWYIMYDDIQKIGEGA